MSISFEQRVERASHAMARHQQRELELFRRAVGREIRFQEQRRRRDELLRERAGLTIDQTDLTQ